MTILLTGATGFIGSTLVDTHDEKFRCVVRYGESHSFENYCEIDSIHSMTDWSGAFEHDIESVLHLAGLAHASTFTNEEYFEVNTEGTLHLAEEAVRAGVKRFVFVSSIGVNGAETNNSPFSVDLKPEPHNAYARSKLNAELGLKKLAAKTGLEVVILRPTLVYGPNAPGNFGMLTKLVKKLPVLPFGLAMNRRDFIAVQNLADLLVTCATHPDAAGHTFLASDGETVSIKDFTNNIAYGLDKKIIQLPIPVALMKLAGRLVGKSAMIEQLFGNLEVDSSNIHQVLGWTPPLTMKQAIAMLRNSGTK